MLKEMSYCMMIGTNKCFGATTHPSILMLLEPIPAVLE